MITLFQALVQFDLANVANGLAVKTCKWYRWLLAESPHSLPRRTGNRPLDQLDRQTLREYIVWLRSQTHSRSGERLREETVNDYIRALHRFFKWCEAEYKADNPMRGIAFPKVAEPKPKALELDDFIAMMKSCAEDTAGIRNRALLAMLLDTGARAGGICRLLMSSLDLERQRALVTEKGGRTRFVYWSSHTHELLKRWIEVRQEQPTLFYNLETGGSLTVQGLRVIIRRIARRAGVTGRVNPHSFRHAMARLYLGGGGDLATLSKLLGHKESRTTIDYYTIFTSDEVGQAHERHSPMNQIKKRQDDPDGLGG